MKLAGFAALPLSSSVATARELPLGQKFAKVTIYQDAGRVLFGFGSLIGVDLRFMRALSTSQQFMQSNR